MKIIKYRLATEINHGTPEEPDIETVLSGVTMPYTEANYAIAQAEAYQGQITAEDDGAPRRLPQPRSSCGQMWISWRPCRGWRCDSV